MGILHSFVNTYCQILKLENKLFLGNFGDHQPLIKGCKVLQTSSFLHRCATSVYLGAVNGQQCRALGWCCFPSVQSRLCSAVSLIAVSRLLSYSRRSLVSVSGRARARRSAACSQKHGEILGQECQMSRIRRSPSKRFI